MKAITVVGVDLAKSVFQIHCADKDGHLIQSKAIKRVQFLRFFSNLKPCLVGMEACGSAHHWARELQAMGHDVRLIAPQFVKAYVKSNKNDAVDAEAICEAVTRPGMRFVGIKSVDQQAILLLHRERDGVTKERTSLINRIRSTLAEFGIAAPTGPHRLKQWFKADYADVEPSLSGLMQRHIQRMLGRLRELEEAITVLDEELDNNSKHTEACRRLEEVPGIGRLTASAIVASIGDGRSFKNGRQFAASLGLVPKQYSSGGKTRLMGISKRGDGYLRRMLIHGARAVLRHMNPKRAVTSWLHELSIRRHRNVVIVAMANKLARIAWALLYHHRHYDDCYGAV